MSACAQRALIVPFPPVPHLRGTPSWFLGTLIRRAKFEWLPLLAPGLRPYPMEMCIRDRVWSLLMGDVAQRGTTVLVSSHNLRELEDVCDHVGILSHGKVLLERSLTDLQDNIIKLQLAFSEPGLPPLPESLNVLHTSQIGRVYTLIVRGDPTQIKERMAALNPILMEMLPLNLEEIFIYELGGEDYAVRDIVL